PWKGTLVCIGKKKNQTIIDLIKTNRPCILACPWSKGTSYSIEILDRLIAFPKIISSTLLTRMDTVRKIYTADPWIIALVDVPEKAGKWRLINQNYFAKASPEQEKEKIASMMSLCSDANTNQSLKKTTSTVYECIRSFATSDNEPDWHSHTLADDDEEVEYLAEDLFVPTQEIKQSQTSKEEFKVRMKGLEKLSATRADKIFQLAWKHREVFDPVTPGKITRYFHEIITTTDRPTNVRAYPLKLGEDTEFVKNELKKLLAEKYIQESISSPYQAPLLVVPKKSPDGKTKKRLCVDYRALNKITKRNVYQMPILDESLRTGEAKFFTKIDLQSAF